MKSTASDKFAVGQEDDEKECLTWSTGVTKSGTGNFLKSGLEQRGLIPTSISSGVHPGGLSTVPTKPVCSLTTSDEDKGCSQAAAALMSVFFSPTEQAESLPPEARDARHAERVAKTSTR